MRVRSQFTSIRFGERLAEIGAVPSIGTVGDSFDNALAETVNGYYKAELIRGPARGGRPWKTVEDVELATLSWVHWHNHDRLHGYLGDVPPTEFEQALYATNRTDQPLVEIQQPESPSEPVRFMQPYHPGLAYQPRVDSPQRTGFLARPRRVDSAAPGSATRNGQLTSAKSQEGYGPPVPMSTKAPIPTGTVKPSPVPVTEASTTVEALDAGRVLGRV